MKQKSSATSALQYLVSFFFLILLFSFSYIPNTKASEPMLFSASVGMPFTNSENTGFEDRLVKEIFKRLGRDVKVQFVPAERALQNLDQGIDDGALGRVAGILTKYKNIRQIKEVAFVRDFVVFTKKPGLKITGWSSLEGFNVGYITGWKIVERNVSNAKSIVKVKDGKQLFNLLESNRADVVVYNRWGGLHLVKELGFKDIHIAEPPLAQAPHYFNLSIKHEEMVEPARNALIEMKKDGTYQRIFDETLAPLAN
ncbi:substrate-binding periplasmic protein [Sneathiella limimaris]|uniref:substrate-binding periplasmic protein n=1 Tax=Sneathiella limimaris TaxID=1964213 RepID=UPI00146E9591|nr:transporter substrate-binding domain-containing protein [Sneathiella limimaris]